MELIKKYYVYIVLFLVVSLLAMFAYIQNTNKQLVKSTIENKVLIKENNELKTEVTNAAESQSVTNEITKEVDDNVVKNNNNTSVIKKTIIEEIKRIDNKYPDTARISAADKLNKDYEIRKVRLEAMWVSFCMKYPQDEECLKN